jgi:glycolate oxidase
MAELEEIYEVAGHICLAEGAEDVLIADTLERQEGIWDARGAFLEALKAESEMDEVDVVVPRDQIAVFINYTKVLEKQYGIRIRSFGHAGDGNMHVYILRDDMDKAVWQSKMQEVMEMLYAKGKDLGGQVSGEHGIGLSKREFLREDLGDSLVALQRHIKQALDPKHILNPGKVIAI